MSRLVIALLAVFTLGCVSKSSQAVLSRQQSLALEVTPLSADGVTEVQAERLNKYLTHSFTQSLAVRGYQVSDLSAVQLRSTWIREASLESSASRNNPLVGISFSVFSPKGERLFSVRSIRCLPLSQWNEARVDTEVRSLMKKFPENKLGL